MDREVLRRQLRLYAVTDRSWVGKYTLPEQVRQAIDGGITMLQWREKKNPNDVEILKEAYCIRELCGKSGIPFIVNDSVEIAVRLDADGVHLGQSDMNPAIARQILGSDKIIGATAKTMDEVRKAEHDGADYLGCGAVFGSSTKKDAVPMTIEHLKELCESTALPVVAIGGIDSDNVYKIKDTGIAGIAAVSAIFGQEDIKEACVRLLSGLMHERGRK